ncbi:unnamed protein product [Lampetra fluviatilis]
MPIVITPTKEKTNNTFHYKIMVKGRKTPMECYWLSDGREWPKFAVELSSIATSSAASDRNFFSITAFAHSDLRRCSPSVASVEKAVFIESNIHDFFHGAIEVIEEDSESDDSAAD